MREASHRLIVIEYIAAEATYARESRTLAQDSRERRSETDSAPIVRDYESELGGFRVGATNVASFRNERCGRINSAIVDLGDERNMSMVDHRELAQEVLGELADRAMKSQPACLARQRCEEIPQCLQVRRQDRADRNVPRVVELYTHAHYSVRTAPACWPTKRRSSALLLNIDLRTSFDCQQ
jgi:hypothetical protein